MWESLRLTTLCASTACYRYSFLPFFLFTKNKEISKSRYICAFDDSRFLWHSSGLSVESRPTFRRNVSPPSSGSRKSQAKSQYEAGNKKVPPELLLTFNGLHGLFINTAGKTSNPTYVCTWSLGCACEFLLFMHTFLLNLRTLINSYIILILN
jgi:hypothetical protein